MFVLAMAEISVWQITCIACYCERSSGDSIDGLRV